MGKMFETKDKIIKMLRENGKMTLSQLSEKLGLAPSTVSQHLDELVNANMVVKVEDEHFKKYKYYLLKESEALEVERSLEPQHKLTLKNRFIIIAILFVGIVALFSFLYVHSVSENSISAKILPGSMALAGTTWVSISDSPGLANLSALYITITGIDLHRTSGIWYNSSIIPKTFDLVKLRNISALLAGINIPNGTYNQVVLRIGNVSGVVNGTNAPVYIPSDRLFLPMKFNISNSTVNWINFDFDIADSIHFAGNSLVMMPVVRVNLDRGSNITIGENDILEVKHRGIEENVGDFGMDENGTMRPGFMIGGNEAIAINEHAQSCAERICHPNLSVYNSNALKIVVVAGNTILVGRAQVPVNPFAQKNFEVSSNGTTINIAIGNGTVKIVSNGRISNVESLVNSEIKKIENETNASIVNMTANATEIFPFNYSIANIAGLGLPNSQEFLNASPYACTSSADCVLVPTSYCDNNLPSQFACINGNYADAYLALYNSEKMHRAPICPMFMLQGHISCECINSYCTLVYSRENIAST